MMTFENPWDETAIPRSDEHFEPNEAKFVFDLWDSLAREDPEAYELILSRNPKLRQDHRNLHKDFADLREALADGPDLVRQEFPEAMAEVDACFDEPTPVEAANEVLSVGPDLTREKHRAVAYSQEGPLTQVARKAGAGELRELYNVIAPKLVTDILERIGMDVPAEAKMTAALHLCHEDVLARFQSTANAGGHVRDALIDELATVLDQLDLDVKVDRDELQKILNHPQIVDKYYALEQCVGVA